MTKPILLLQIRPEDAASDGEYEAILKFGELAENNVARVRIEQNGVPKIHLEDYSAVIIGGGPWNPSDPDEKKSEAQKRGEAELIPLIQSIIQIDKPCFAICYGLEALAVATQTPLTYEFGEKVGGVDLIITEDGLQDTLLSELPNPFRGFVGHKESLAVVPENAKLLIKSETCPVEMFRIGKNVYATQFHPELDVSGIIARTDIYKHAGYFPPEEAETLKDRLRKEEVFIPMEILKRFVQLYYK